MIPTSYRLVLGTLVVSASMLGGALWSSPAAACKCKLPTVEEAKEGAVAIFEGRVTKVEDEAKVEGGPPPGKRITFALVRTWKGLEDQEVISLRTNESSASCGYTFEPNTSYLVYAGGEPGALSVTTCSRTRTMGDAAEDMGPLGAGITPVKVEPVVDAGADAGKEPPKKKGAGCATSHSASGSASTSSALVWLLAAPALGFSWRRRRD
jgi:MYXO-CTERM domain-containing protein